MKKTNKPVIVEEIFNVSIKQLWKALTEVDQMRCWFFENIPEFVPEVGFKTQFNVNSGERNFLHIWEIIEVELPKKIKYNWKYDGYSGNSFVIFEMFATGKKTKLKLTHETTEDFEENIPEFTRENCLAGWNYFIKESLKNYLEKE